MSRNGGGFALGLETRVTIGVIVSMFGGFYWLIMLGARVDAAVRDAARVEAELVETRRLIVERLDQISSQQSSMAVDVAGIEAQLRLLIQYQKADKRPNERP